MDLKVYLCEMKIYIYQGNSLNDYRVIVIAAVDMEMAQYIIRNQLLQLDFDGDLGDIKEFEITGPQILHY